MKGDEKVEGIKARNYLIKLLTNITIDKNTYTRYDIRKLINKFGDFDKYGRPLGTIYKDETNY